MELMLEYPLPHTSIVWDFYFSFVAAGSDPKVSYNVTQCQSSCFPAKWQAFYLNIWTRILFSRFLILLWATVTSRKAFDDENICVPNHSINRQCDKRLLEQHTAKTMALRHSLKIIKKANWGSSRLKRFSLSMESKFYIIHTHSCVRANELTRKPHACNVAITEILKLSELGDAFLYRCHSIGGSSNGYLLGASIHTVIA